jgi:hypothetical protein
MKTIYQWTLSGLAATAAMMLAGCGTTAGVGGGAGSFVSTSISNSTPERVDEAVKAVFLGDGFQLVRQNGNFYHFRKWGGTSTEIMFGSWFTEGVAAEPELVVFNKGGGSFMLHCDVYMREHSGSELLDANHKLRLTGKSAYNSLLRKVKKRAEGS